MQLGKSLALATVLSLLAAEAHASSRQLVVQGPFAHHTSAHPIEKARSIVAEAAPFSRKLTLSPKTKLASGRAVELLQTHRGLPVLRRGAGIALDANGNARFAVIRLEENLPDDTIPGVDATQAARIAKTLSGLETKPSDARLVVFPTPDRARLAWLVAPSGRVPTVPYAPVLVLDAKTGETIVRWNAVNTAMARVYPANPISTPNLVEVELPVAEGASSLLNDRVRSTNCVDFGGFRIMDGAEIRVCEVMHSAVADKNGDFLHPPAADEEPDDAFAEISLFFHTNRAYDYFVDLGMPELPPITTVSNLRLASGLMGEGGDPSSGLVPYQNAFYVGGHTIFSELFDASPPALFFGQGPLRDYSYDGDVVYHEFGHAVVDHTIEFPFWFHVDEQGISSSPGAMNEALADYFAVVLTGDPHMGEYAAGDLGLESNGIRDLDSSETCPENLAGEVHTDSLFFSSALWSIRSSLAESDRPVFDQAIFDVLVTAPDGDLGFEDFSELLLTSVRSSPLGEPGAKVAEDALRARGVLPRCDRRITWQGEPIDSKDPLLENAFIAPGVNDVPIAPLPYAPGIVQFRVPLEETGHLAMTFEATRLPGSNGTPFRPRVLVRWGEEPIGFDWSPFNALHDAQLAPKTMASASSYRAQIQIPEGVTTAHVMIVNAGETQGIYKQVQFEFDNRDGSLPPDVAASDSFVPPSKDGGCTIALPGSSLSSGAWLAGLLLASGAALRRRRK